MNGKHELVAVALTPEEWERVAHALHAKASILEDIEGHDPAFVQRYRALAGAIRAQVHAAAGDPSATRTRLIVRVPGEGGTR